MGCCTTKPQRDKYQQGPAPKYMNKQQTDDMIRKSIQKDQTKRSYIQQQQQQQSQRQNNQQQNHQQQELQMNPKNPYMEHEEVVIEKQSAIQNDQQQPVAQRNTNSQVVSNGNAQQQDINLQKQPSVKRKSILKNANQQQQIQSQLQASQQQNNDLTIRKEDDDDNIQEQDLNETKHIGQYMNNRDSNIKNLDNLVDENQQQNGQSSNNQEQKIDSINGDIFDYHMKAIIKTINLQAPFSQNIDISIPEKQNQHYYVEAFAYSGQIDTQIEQSAVPLKI